MGQRFSKDASKFVNELMRDIITYKLSRKEGMKYIEVRFRKISLSIYKKRLALVQADKTINVWMNYFTRIGFVKHHKEQLENAQRFQDHTMKQFIIEISKQNPDQDYILKLKHDGRENIRLLTDLGLGTPIISAIKAKLDKVESKYDSSIQTSREIISSGR